MVQNGVSTQEAHYFFLPLWNPTFSPQANELGIIDWFTLFLGVVSVVALTIHGANWIIYKTNSALNPKLKSGFWFEYCSTDFGLYFVADLAFY